MILGKLKEEEWCWNVRIDVHCFIELVNSICDHVQTNSKSFRIDVVSGEKKTCSGIVLFKRPSVILNDFEHIWCIFGNIIKIVTDGVLCYQ